MTPDETFGVWGMNVVFGVRMLMVSTVVRGPPQWTPLSGTACYGGTDKLDQSTGLERAVGKVAVVKGSDRKHPYSVRKQGNENAG